MPEEKPASRASDLKNGAVNFKPLRYYAMIYTAEIHPHQTKNNYTFQVVGWVIFLRYAIISHPCTYTHTTGLVGSCRFFSEYTLNKDGADSVPFFNFTLNQQLNL